MLERNKIYFDDCIDGMKKIENEVCDLIIADIPYNIGIAEWDTWKTIQEYKMWLDKIFLECFRILKPTGQIYVYSSEQYIAEVKLLLDKYFSFKNIIIWSRDGNPIAKKYFTRLYEPICYYTKSEKYQINWENIKIPTKCNDKRWNKEKNPSNVWMIPRLQGNSKERVGHPSQKPLAIRDRIIKASSKENDLICIPFVGSGSEIISAINNNRNYIGFELEKKYFDLAVNRINDLTKKK